MVSRPLLLIHFFLLISFLLVGCRSKENVNPNKLTIGVVSYENGLTLAEVRFAPTPKTILEWLSQEQVDAGALSEGDFEQYSQEFQSTDFRILHQSRWIPPGVVLLGPTLERNRQEHIIEVMKNAPSSLIGDAGYVPTTEVPDYEQFIELVEKVQPLETQVQETPAILITKESK